MEEPSIPERMDNEEEEVRILSYNIWFDNNHAQMARTEYLGRVIESCDPDVLCLQEVTLPILFVMQGQVWFEKYHLCAQPSEKELQCGYFCVVLVKKKETIRKTRVEKDGNVSTDTTNEQAGGNQNTQGALQEEERNKQFSGAIKDAVVREIVEQKRPGGLLYNEQRTSA